MSEQNGLPGPAPDLVVLQEDAPEQTDNSAEFDEVLPQDPNWRPDDATDVAP